MLIPEAEYPDYLEHYGTPRHSGRYPWGSGENPYQSAKGARSKLYYIDDLHKQGLTDKEICSVLGIKTNELRAIRAVGREQQRAADAAQAYRLKQKGYSNVKIGEIMGKPDTTVGNLLRRYEKGNEQKTNNVRDILKEQISEKKYIDVGPGVEQYLGVTRTRLDSAIEALKAEGYSYHTFKVQQMGTEYKTTMRVLAPPDTEWKEVVQNKGDIQLPFGVKFEEDGRTTRNLKDPVALDSNRVSVRYAEDGGKDMDGVMQIRRGVEDLTLGQARYAQVRIQVGDGHFLKGMAMYADEEETANWPKGVDIIFNTNKTKDVPMMGDDPDNTVLKQLKKNKDGTINKENPFGASLTQYTYDPDEPSRLVLIDQVQYHDKSGKMQQSPINIVNQEGDWANWSKTLASQYLSKQPLQEVKERLKATYDDHYKEFEEISSLTNPAVKKKLLEQYAEDCDSAAVHLKAKGYAGQASKVILPFPDIPEDQIYAPGYKDGDRVALIRYPHAGRFEIAELTVNNQLKQPNGIIRNAIDAVGIHPRVAERLSGADFDGDTVTVIPNNDNKVKTMAPLKALKNFDPSDAYPAYEGMPRVGPEHGFHKQQEMGKVTNLITDMTLLGAQPSEIARAVKHSMVIIDAEKHNLNWKQSALDNGISELKEKYQGGKDAGAATLISKAKGQYRMPQIAKNYGIAPYNTDPETGERIDRPTGATYRTKTVNPDGTVTYSEPKIRMTKTTKMAATKDARTLLSKTPDPREIEYANYANKMKALANKARKEYLDTPNLKQNPDAKEKYKEQVVSLNIKLNEAKKNAPLERQAQIYANVWTAAAKRENPDMDKDELKKIKSQTLSAARNRTGAQKQRVRIDDKEWEAIQAGAISHSKLMQILNNADMDVVRAYATPRSNAGLTPAQVSRAKSMLANPKTSMADVAQALGVSVSSITAIVRD